MSDNVRRIRLGDTRYRLKPLTREQKLLPDIWLSDYSQGNGENALYNRL